MTAVEHGGFVVRCARDNPPMSQSANLSMNKLKENGQRGTGTRRGKGLGRHGNQSRLWCISQEGSAMEKRTRLFSTWCPDALVSPAFSPC